MMKTWFLQALTAEHREIDDVHPELDAEIVEVFRTGLSADPAEVDVLHTALQRRHRSSSTWVWGGLALAVVVVVFLFALVPLLKEAEPEYGTLSVALQEFVPQNTAITLGPSITLQGMGELTVERAGPSGTEVHLVEGAYDFEVDPNGPFRDFTVIAGGVQTRVHGTRFSVQRLANQVKVNVSRGQVSVEHRGQSQFINAGQSWSSPELALQPEETEETEETEATLPELIEPPPELSEPTPELSEPPPRQIEAKSADMEAPSALEPRDDAIAL
ncbi:MAG: hypothetical protein HN348_11415, partial [Proteobacteria bacterium]|nr:hypothetical protein [Pseudomonadota bacterium]